MKAKTLLLTTLTILGFTFAGPVSALDVNDQYRAKVLDFRSIRENSMERAMGSSSTEFDENSYRAQADFSSWSSPDSMMQEPSDQQRDQQLQDGMKASMRSDINTFENRAYYTAEPFLYQ